MSIVTNGTTIPEDGDNVIYDGVVITQVICNGVSVWEQVMGDHQLTIATDENQTGYNDYVSLGALVPPTVDTTGGVADVLGLNVNVHTGLCTLLFSFAVPVVGRTFAVDYNGTTSTTGVAPTNTVSWDDPALSAWLIANDGTTQYITLREVV